MKVKIEFSSAEERIDFYKAISGKPEAEDDEIEVYEDTLLGKIAHELGIKYLQGYSARPGRAGEVPLDRLKDFRGRAGAEERRAALEAKRAEKKGK